MKYLKYNTLSKKEKKELKKKYYSTEKGALQKQRFIRILIWIILLFSASIYLIIDSTIIKYNIWQLIYGILLLIISIVFYIIRLRTIQKTINNYLVK